MSLNLSTLPGPLVSGRDWAVLIGDNRARLRDLPAQSVHCCVTSPPYFGLRTYEGGSLEIGREATPDEFVAAMLSVFGEVWRVLRDDGVLFLNLGDSYAASGGAHVGRADNQQGVGAKRVHSAGAGDSAAIRRAPGDLKPKDLCGIPWRVAFALQAAGWYLRSEIIWHKPNPMPESVTDRPTKAHEHIFVLTKSERYFWDQQAVREPVRESSLARIRQATFDQQTGGEKDYRNGTNANRSMRKAIENFAEVAETQGRNPRDVMRFPYSLEDACALLALLNAEPPEDGDVLTLTTEPTSLAHFATFPSSLPTWCIKAATSEKGCCPKCGAQWKREVEVEVEGESLKASGKNAEFYVSRMGAPMLGPNVQRSSITRGWVPGCECGITETVPAIVLDCFSGAGTTGKSATSLGRQYVGQELKPEYAELSRARINEWKIADLPKGPKPSERQAALFE